jgi:TIR domain
MQLQTPQVQKIFYCYAHADETLRNELEKHLRRQGGFLNWHDRNIRAGGDWQEEIDIHLNAADVILLLLSPDFVASDYCYGSEMQRALERHHKGEALVIPVLLRPVQLDNVPFSTLQVLPTNRLPVTKWENRDEAFVSIAMEIQRSVEILKAQKQSSLQIHDQPHTVFLSYARSDAEFATRLKDDLQVAGVIPWIDREGLQLGTADWEESVRQAIRDARAVVFIASPGARTSRYVRDELRIAEMYGRPMYPIWAEGKEWMDVAPLGLGGMQYIDAREDYPEALKSILAALRQALLSSASAQEVDFEPRNPYKGLRAFTAEDIRDFFGRRDLVDSLMDMVELSLLASDTLPQPPAFLALLGSSGAGKSSIVMAGLLPALKAGGVSGSKEWIYLTPLRPSRHPIEALMQVISEHLPNKSLRAIREDLNDDTARGLYWYSGLLTKHYGSKGGKVVLFIDQFEELFTQTVSEDERQHFIDLLTTALTEPDSSTLLILTLRADFYDRVTQYPFLAQLIKEHQQLILPMTIKDLRTVIEKPAALPDVQLTFEDGLVGDLLFEVHGQTGALPLLQFTLDLLFQRRQGHLLTHKAYREIGGVRGALAQHAEMTYAALPSESHQELARILFLRLIDPGTTEQDTTTRRRATMAELTFPDAIQTALLQGTTQVFVTARLLTTDTIGGISLLEISHEALIREWKRLADWLVTHRNDIVLQKALGRDVAEWIRRDKPTDRLYRGTQLTEAQVWAERNRPSVDEVAFLQASVAERKREQAERAQHMRELDLQRLAARRLRYLSSMAAVTAVVLAVGLIVSLVLYAQLQVSLPASVTNLNDHGPGSLREAIKNASPGSTISFAKNLKGTIALTSGELVITKNLIIAGPGESLLSISGSGMSRVFSIHEGVTAAIFGITITRGRGPLDGGGGILNKGVLTLTDSTVSECVAASGGGIVNLGVLTITNSSISGNKADAWGGGIFNSSTLNIIRSTISHNTAGRAGGGIDNGFLLSLGTSTIAHNRTTSGWGGGLNVGGGGQADIHQSTIYGNTAATWGGNVHTFPSIRLRTSIIAGGNASLGKDVSGTVGSFGHGYNLIGTLDGAILTDDGTLPINFIGSPNVGPLQDNGGPTQTMALLAGSPAIDFIPLSICSSTTTDQRGRPRPDRNVAACDIGAYESTGLSTTTAQAKANAKAEAAANASPIAYPPRNQSPALTDPLEDNSKGNNWEVDTNRGNCKFIDGAYDIKTNELEWCPALATDFTNFIYEVQMKIVTGDGGGIAFRFDPATQQNYSFVINQNGSYSVYADDIMLASGESSAIHWGLKQINLVAAVAHDQIIELYVNLQRVAVVGMVAGARAPTHGQIAVIVTGDRHSTEVIFQNAKVWRV